MFVLNLILCFKNRQIENFWFLYQKIVRWNGLVLFKWKACSTFQFIGIDNVCNRNEMVFISFGYFTYRNTVHQVQVNNVNTFCMWNDFVLEFLCCLQLREGEFRESISSLSLLFELSVMRCELIGIKHGKTKFWHLHYFFIFGLLISL